MITRKTRIKDIARLAGVSIGTVDRVLHERGEVAVRTREKVKLILKETNYSPNVMAQVLKSRKGHQDIVDDIDASVDPTTQKPSDSADDGANDKRQRDDPKRNQ